jgi:hypothetical protein
MNGKSHVQDAIGADVESFGVRVNKINRGPAFWLGQMNEPRGDGAIHVAIWAPYEQAEARITAALAVGGRMVRDEFAPA